MSTTDVFTKANAREQLRVYGVDLKLPTGNHKLVITSDPGYKLIEIYRVDGSPATWRFIWHQ